MEHSEQIKDELLSTDLDKLALWASKHMDNNELELKLFIGMCAVYDELPEELQEAVNGIHFSGTDTHPEADDNNSKFILMAVSYYERLRPFYSAYNTIEKIADECIECMDRVRRLCKRDGMEIEDLISYEQKFEL